jgi:hypothetical protein
LHGSLGLAVGLACVVPEITTAAEGARRRFDIPAGDAVVTLKQFLSQAGAHVLYSPDDVGGVRTHAVQGEFPPLAALTRMLAGTPLRAREDPETNALSITLGSPSRSPPSAPRQSRSSPSSYTNRPDSPSTMKRSIISSFGIWLGAVLGSGLDAQTNPSNPASGDNAATANKEDVVQLSPFTVESSAETGYMATTSLAGTRLRTELKDIGTSISVLTKEFLDDIGATDNQSALTYATNMEVGGVMGNYQDAPPTGSWGLAAEENNRFNPNNNTRVRGLVSADNTRNYFRTSVAWDGYNVGRIDILRGPNSILFGLGSPGGVVNATTDAANLNRDSGEVNVVTDEFGSYRGTLNLNKAILKNELGFRLAALNEREKFQQDPAYDDEDRIFAAAKYRPRLLNRNGVSFDLALDFERGDGTANRPRTAPPHDYITAWIQPVSTRPIQLPAGTNFMGYANGVIPAMTQFVNQAGVTFLANVGGTLPTGISGWADAFGPRLNVNSHAGNGDFWRQGRVWVEGVRLANGTTYIGNPQTARRLFGYGNAFQDSPIQTLNAYVQAQGHPLGSFFLPPQISDPSLFDFYNKLLDGPNKEESNDFNQSHEVAADAVMITLAPSRRCSGAIVSPCRTPIVFTRMSASTSARSVISRLAASRLAMPAFRTRMSSSPVRWVVVSRASRIWRGSAASAATNLAPTSSTSGR